MRVVAQSEARMNLDEGETKIVSGQIAGAYGVKGWVNVVSFTKPLTNLLRYKTWLLKDGKTWRPLVVEQGKTHGKGLVAKLVGVDDRDQALALNGVEIAILRSQLPELDTGEYYWADLIGFTVANVDGVTFGTIDHLFETGSNDVMVVKGEREHLVPFIKDQVVKSVDVTSKRILVDWPEEL